MARPASGYKCKLYLPPLHIKRSLIKIALQAMCKWNEGFAFLNAKISKMKCDQGERRNFLLSTNYTIIRRPRFSTKLNCTWRSLNGVWTRLQKLSRQQNWKITMKTCRIWFHQTVLWGVTCHWNLIFWIPLWNFFWKHGSRLEWTWWNMPSVYSIRLFHKLKRVTVEMEPKFVGWLLLESYKGNNNWRKWEAKEAKTIVSWFFF